MTVLAMVEQKINIIFMSGRDSKYREPTIRQIEMYAKLKNLPGGGCAVNFAPVDLEKVIPYQLYMRGEGDQRKDAIVKSELFDEHVRDKYNVLFVLDDRDQVVRHWRSIGLTCYQVAPGAF